MELSYFQRFLLSFVIVLNILGQILKSLNSEVCGIFHLDLQNLPSSAM